MAKRDLGAVPAVYPMPVLIVAAYDKVDPAKLCAIIFDQFQS